jgi:hypothetical protein
MLAAMALTDPDFAGLLSSLSALAAMAWLGLRYKLLEPRHRSRPCPACGRMSGTWRPCACRG